MTINLENINNPEDIENNEVVEHLSILERYILTYIKFRSNNAHIYYGSNEDIAKHAQCKLASAKTKVNQLIRQGYLDKGQDEYGRRTLTPTTKYYIPLDGVNMSNKSKSLMKQDIQNFERMEKQYKQDLSSLKQQIADITLERDELDKALHKIIKGLEKRGISLKEVQTMIKEEDDYQPTMPEVLPTIEKPLEKPAETPVSISDNTAANDVQAKIDEILAKFKIPEDYSRVMWWLGNLLLKSKRKGA